MPRFPRNLVLIGARGSGKSAVGTRLAAAMGRHFNDTDEMIADWEGLPIPQIWAAYGEAYFRDVESHVIEQVTGRGAKVIATGGGAVLRPANVVQLQGSGLLIWLRAPAGTLRARLAADAAGLAGRPALTGGDPLEELAAVLAAREPLYRAAADHVVETDGLDLDAVVAAIQRWHDGGPPGLALDYDPAAPCAAGADAAGGS